MLARGIPLTGEALASAICDGSHRRLVKSVMVSPVAPAYTNVIETGCSADSGSRGAKPTTTRRNDTVVLTNEKLAETARGYFDLPVGVCESQESDIWG